jgi:Tol biopolymer transport system component
MRRTLVRTAVLLATSCALCAGCGDDDATPKATTTAAPAPATAADGLIVYGAEKEGVPTQLVTIKPDGTGETQITHLTDGEAVNPDWSPDGSQIVYNGQSAAGSGIIVIAADGSGARNLTPKGEQGQPAFSPDGRRIVFESDVSDNGVFLMNTDGSNRRRLTRSAFRQPDGGPCCDTDPNFSPDGKTITFVRIKKPDELQALFAMDADGTHLRRLTPYSDDVAIKHAWAPDGSRIVITTNANPAPGESSNILTIKPDGSDRRSLTTFKDGRRAFVGSYSPDGTKIVMRLEDGDRFSLATIPSDGGTITKLTTGTTKPRFIDWGKSG